MSRENPNAPFELSDASLEILEMLKQQGRDSCAGPVGEKRGNAIERVLSRVLPEYAKALDLTQDEVLEALERKRNYNAPNYYQDANLPPLNDVVVYDTKVAFKARIPSGTFRCPSCRGVSRDPYRCDSGVVREGQVCDWAAGGLFGTLGKGYRVVVKETFLDHPQIHEIFMPIDLEPSSETAA